jgi:dTDP-3-amino-3,4,6-trideoxy-alpha-D-glucose transaminase
VSRVAYVNFPRLNERFGAELHGVFARVMESGVYMGGPEVAEFEREFAAFCGTRFAVGVANGLEALELTLRAWRVGPGDEVVVPANTAVQTALAVSHTGARVVLADAEPDTGSLDPRALAAALTPATRAVVPVHLYGHAVDMDAVRALARGAGVRVLEDAAHAHGARYRERRCGSLGDAAAFSFYPTKNLGAFGDAGCVTTDDAELAAELRLLRAAGLTTSYEHVRRGFTARLDPLQAALLRWKLAHLETWNERRRTLARIYLDELADVAGVTLPVVRAWATPVWHAFPVRVHGGLRDAVQRALLDAGVETNSHYRVPVHLQPCYAGEAWRAGDFPVSELRARELLSLPLDPFHTEDEIAHAAAALRAALNGLRAAGRPAGVA